MRGMRLMTAVLHCARTMRCRADQEILIRRYYCCRDSSRLRDGRRLRGDARNRAHECGSCNEEFTRFIFLHDMGRSVWMVKKLRMLCITTTQLSGFGGVT